MIYLFEINKMIEQLTDAGENVNSKDYAVYTSPDTEFSNDVYPLEIIPIDTMPKGTACIICRKVER